MSRKAQQPPASEGVAGGPSSLPLEQAGLPLDKLGEAFAEMLSSGDDPYAAPAEKSPLGGRTQPGMVVEDRQSDDACEITPQSILEAMLFVGSSDNRPLASQQVASLMRGVRPAEVDALVRKLNEDYQARRCPYRIVSEGAGYRLLLDERYARVRDKFYGKARQARLSQAAVEVLAAVAYHEPLTSDEISKLRGTPSSAVISQLLRRQLLRLERSDTKPRVSRYYTTPRFMELFGLASLDDLPRSEDIEQT